MGKVFDKRKERLVGKYLILSNSRYDKDTILYLQDEKCGNGYWTKYIKNAMGYTNIWDAIDRLNTLQYNNPSIVIMDTDYKLIKININ